MPVTATPLLSPNPEVDIRRRLAIGGVTILGMMVFALAVSNQSFWIDEASTAHKAITPTLKAWWERLRAEGTSNLQLPLYMLYAWAWEKMLGPEEWALRAGNIPWVVLALVVVNKLFRQSLSLRVS